MPVSVVDGERNAARDVSMTEVVTQTHLSLLDLQDDREEGVINTQYTSVEYTQILISGQIPGWRQSQRG